MIDTVNLRINGVSLNVPAGTIVAAAVARAGLTRFHSSVLAQPRGPLCGMGICLECRLTINGKPFCRSCQTLCEQDMDVRTAVP